MCVCVCVCVCVCDEGGGVVPQLVVVVLVEKFRETP